MLCNSGAGTAHILLLEFCLGMAFLSGCSVVIGAHSGNKGEGCLLGIVCENGTDNFKAKSAS